VSPRYDDALSLRDARALYFATAGFDESSYAERWVRFQAGPLRFAIPNSAARVRAVRLHDLHHVVTGYDTSWTGEGEIGAWEVASGCAHHHAAWLLNLYAMAIGLVIAPRTTFAAFVRGRRSRNLYREEYRDALLAETVGGARRRLGLGGASAPPSSARERAAFAFWSLTAIATFVATFVPGAILVALLVSALR
jgi:hypothetical protein